MLCVVGLGYGRFGGSVDRGGGWYVCVTKPEWLDACWEIPEHTSSGDTPMTPDYTAFRVLSSGNA